MSWSTPPTALVGQLIRSSDYNTYTRDNLNYLLQGRINSVIKRDNNAAYSTSSTTFVDIDSTNLAITVTLNGTKVLVGFVGAVINAANNPPATNGDTAAFDVLVNGTRYASGGGQGLIAPSYVTAGMMGVSFCVPVTGLSVGSNTFKMQWKRLSINIGSAYLAAGDQTIAATDYTPIFWAMEIG